MNRRKKPDVASSSSPGRPVAARVSVIGLTSTHRIRPSVDFPLLRKPQGLNTARDAFVPEPIRGGLAQEKPDNHWPGLLSLQ